MASSPSQSQASWTTVPQEDQAPKAEAGETTESLPAALPIITKLLTALFPQGRLEIPQDEMPQRGQEGFER